MWHCLFVFVLFCSLYFFLQAMLNSLLQSCKFVHKNYNAISNTAYDNLCCKLSKYASVPV